MLKISKQKKNDLCIFFLKTILFFFTHRNTTHVIFKDGLQSTYDKAKKVLNIPIVSVLWLEACKKQMRLVDVTEFSISNAHRYDYPEQYEKLKVSERVP